jgi:hypothetical protein
MRLMLRSNGCFRCAAAVQSMQSHSILGNTGCSFVDCTGRACSAYSSTLSRLKLLWHILHLD